MILYWILLFSWLNNIDPDLSLAVAITESGLNKDAISTKGAVGVMQLLPSSFPEYSIVELLAPKLNIELGIKYLKKLKRLCPNSYLVCYNSGIENARKIVNFKDQSYYKKVTKLMAEFKKGDRIKILKLYNLNIDGEATYLSEAWDQTHFKGYHRVLTDEGNVMLVDRYRIEEIKERKK